MLLQDSQGRSQTFPEIDAVSTSQLLRGNTKGISNQYPNLTRVSPLPNMNSIEYV